MGQFNLMTLMNLRLSFEMKEDTNINIAAKMKETMIFLISHVFTDGIKMNTNLTIQQLLSLHDNNKENAFKHI